MVRAHDPIDDGEAEAGADGDAARLVQPCERLAHALDLALWDARSAVGDLDARLPPRAGDRHLQRSVRSRVAQRVVDQVGERAPDRQRARLGEQALGDVEPQVTPRRR